MHVVFLPPPLLMINKDLKESYELILQNDYKFVFSATEFPHPIERGFKKKDTGKGLEMLFSIT